MKCLNPKPFLNTTGSTDSTACTPCGAGTFAAAPGTSACAACAAGSYADAPGHTQCTLCAAGTFLATTVGTCPCLSCPVNTYASTSGNTVCTPCPDHAPHAHARSVSAAECFRASSALARDSFVDRELEALQAAFDSRDAVLSAHEYPLLKAEALDGAWPREALLAAQIRVLP